MSADFLDSNVLLYAASGDTRKADRVEALLETGGCISVQVLNEVASVARRKMRLSWNDTRALLGAFRALLEVRPLTLAMHDTGLALAERYRLSLYDAMIVAAALEAGCETLWSEDMQDGLVVADRLRIANPFAGPP
jgi:predicted nucleic acid-binding protein